MNKLEVENLEAAFYYEIFRVKPQCSKLVFGVLSVVAIAVVRTFRRYVSGKL